MLNWLMSLFVLVKLPVANRNSLTRPTIFIQDFNFNCVNFVLRIEIYFANENVFLYNFFLCRYLLSSNVLAAAISRKCTMLHPGYGFLAENAGFVDMCQEHGVNFIGPHVSRLCLCLVNFLSLL